MFLDQVRDDFRIRLGRELVTFFQELALERKVVLNDAVVRDNDTSFAIPMRMSILFGRPAVSRPARMTQAKLSRSAAALRARSSRFFSLPEHRRIWRFSILIMAIPAES